MKLGQFLSQAPTAPVKRVRFQVVGRDREEFVVRAEAEADLVFVDERARLQAERDARSYLASLPGSGAPSTEDINAEEAYHLLHLALRDTADVRTPFAGTVDELRRALVAPVAQRLAAAYWRFVAAEFPDVTTDKEQEKLEEEARGK